MKELAKQFDCEFEQHYVEVLNFIAAEDTTALESVEAVFDEHVDCVTEFIERLEQLETLVGTTEPVIPHASDKGFGKTEVKSISEAGTSQPKIESSARLFDQSKESCARRKGNRHVLIGKP